MLQYLNRYAVRNNNNSVDGRKYLIARRAYSIVAQGDEYD